ncbi:hypothetical protein FOL47_004848 [Perkinsus chesapeaki]|uniref:Uncharacterized protein n=1 Tax=Perkinsus chesapeaki TaxID=330153 RepID=A0A7J6M193_PERCH|nr:hypothetical protein FOL47_004848 [Perkinsus chesapeaki]
MERLMLRASQRYTLLLVSSLISQIHVFALRSSVAAVSDIINIDERSYCIVFGWTVGALARDASGERSVVDLRNADGLVRMMGPETLKEGLRDPVEILSPKLGKVPGLRQSSASK